MKKQQPIDDKLYKHLGYRFKDPSLLAQALTHRSVSAKNNERLEFLGDAILGFVIAEYIYQSHPFLTEGEMTQIRAHLVRGTHLTRIAEDLQLIPYLAEVNQGKSGKKSHFANAVEAILAAIFLDSDLPTCRACIYRWFNPYLKDIIALAQQRDPKSTLQELLQKQKIPLPIYSIVKEEGKEHAKTFTVCCRIEDLNKESYAQGSTRRAAEQLAAQKLVEQLQ